VRVGEHGIPATVRLVQPVGPATHLTLDWAGGELTASLPGFVRLETGSKVMVEIDPDHLLTFDRETGQRI